MTTTDDDTEAGWATENWTYGGLAAGKTRPVGIWYDEDNRNDRLAFSPDKGRHLVPGGIYAVQAHRDGNGKVDQRRGDPVFVALHDDPDWRAALEANDYAHRREVAAGQVERRAARDSALDAAIAPLEKIAAGMNYAQREALIALVTRKVYRAETGR